MKIQYYSGAKTYYEALDTPGVYKKTHYKIVENEGIIGFFSFSLGYMFCCGMREIGGFEGPYDNTPLSTDKVKQFCIALCDLLNADYMDCVGALTLTENVSKTGIRRVPMLWQQLIDTWPKASHSQPFYNPNSGNTVIQWVLPIPGRTTREEFYSSEEQEEED